MEIIKFRSQLFIALEEATVRFHQAQNTWARLQKSVARESGGLREALRAKESDFWQWLESFVDTVIVINNRLKKFRSRCFAVSNNVAIHLRGVKNRFATVSRSVAEKPQRVQEALRARGNDLPRLLESSPDAIVVMNTDLRFVAANPKALDAFGISQKNMAMFGIDAFLPRHQILCFDENSAPFISRKEWHGECQIRRLDGSLRVAEFIFVANYVPFLHLCMFRNDRKWQREKRLLPNSAVVG